MNNKICIFGEVLFDHFPDGMRVLGGAPFNVAWHLQAFGEFPAFISRVGDDAEGRAIRQAMADWGMNTDGLQLDQKLSSGRVSIEMDNGEPRYDIVEPVAYDAISYSGESACRLLYHGTLALRHAASAEALEQYRASGPEIIFIDVNLRPPWWQRSAVLGLLKQANWAKLNMEEFRLLQHGTPDTGESAAHDFLLDNALDGMVLTHGADGAEVFTADGKHFTVKPDGETRVVDPVGAGDAFTSVFLLGLIRGWDLGDTMNRAQSFASLVVAQQGAIQHDHAVYSENIARWQ